METKEPRLSATGGDDRIYVATTTASPETTMHHRRGSDSRDSQFEHLRETDPLVFGIDAPKRVELGRVVSILISAATSLVIGASSWFALQYRVDANHDETVRVAAQVAKIEADKERDDEKTRESTAQQAIALARVAEQLAEVNRRLDDLKSDVQAIEHGRRTP